MYNFSVKFCINTCLILFALNNFCLFAETESNVSFFENKIRPLLVEKCFSCHSEEAETNGKLKAGLLLDSAESIIKGGDSGAVLVPGKPEDSKIFEAIVEEK